MQAAKLIAIVLIAAGVLALIYGGFTYTHATHEANIGPLDISVHDNRTVNVPVWMGVAAIVIGGALLLIDNRKGA